MKKQILILFLLIPSAALFSSNTYETLRKNRWTDHVLFFNVLFKNIQINNLFEFGLGEGTKFFLENCNHVSSLELATTDPSFENWYNKCRNMYKYNKNWTGAFHTCSDDITEITRLGHLQKNTNNLPIKITHELKTIIKEYLPRNKYDLIFVDCGVLVRADITNLVFGLSKIVVTHDTGDSAETYGWDRLTSPTNYSMFKSTDNRTTVWVRKSETNLISNLENEPYLKKI